MTECAFKKYKLDLLQWAVERGACGEGLLEVMMAEDFAELRHLWRKHWVSFVARRLQDDGVEACSSMQDLANIKFVNMPPCEERQRAARARLKVSFFVYGYCSTAKVSGVVRDLEAMDERFRVEDERFVHLRRVYPGEWLRIGCTG